jgi:WD40 repeat protein
VRALTEEELGEEVRGLGVSPSGDAVYLALRNGELAIWSPDSGPEVRRWGQPGSLNEAMALSPDGAHIALAKEDNSLEVWNVTARARSAREQADQFYITGVSFSPDGKRLYTSGWDGSLVVWSLDSSGGVTRGIRATGHTSSVTALAVAGDGQSIVTVSSDMTMRLWAPESLRPLDTFLLPCKPLCLTCGADRRIVVGGPDGLILRFQPRSITV